jgi:hypothetical protein
MSHATTESLPTLAHQVIVHPGRWFDNNEAHLPEYLPPFPEINLNSWDGFALSCLHWVGVRASNTDISKEEQGRRIELAADHELYHRALSQTPFSILKKYELFKLYDLIVTTFEKEQERIRVPLIPDESGTDLQKQLSEIVHLQRVSMLVEEVFAIFSSLTKALNKRLILHSEYNDLREAYKVSYGYIPKFSSAYDAFDFVVGKIGERAAAAIIYTALGTLNPTEAFLDIMSAMCKIPRHYSTKDFLWQLSPKETKSITNYSFEDANRFFSRLINVLDPDDSRYKMKRMSEIAAAIKQQWSVDTQGLDDDFYRLPFGSSTTAFIFSEYDYFIHVFHKVKNSLEVEFGNHIILLEAIRQQLTTGRGLLCPFWAYGHGCCSSENKALFEQVWSRTSPNSSCRLWRRMGCLNQPKQWKFQIPYRQVKRKNLKCYNDGMGERPYRPDVEKAKLQTSSKAEESIEGFALSDIPDEVKVVVFEEVASLFHDIFLAPQNNTPIVEVLEQKQQTLRQKGDVVFVGQPQPPETGQAPDLSEIPHCGQTEQMFRNRHSIGPI